MSKTKHDAMQEFFEPAVNQLAGELLHFNFSSEEEGSISFITNYSGKLLKRYFGGAKKEYGFTIVITKPYSIYTDEVNLEAMNFAQGLMDWVDEQNQKKNFPAFPANCQVLSLENLQNMPNLAGINAEEGVAQYMVQCRVTYYEREV